MLQIWVNVSKEGKTAEDLELFMLMYHAHSADSGGTV